MKSKIINVLERLGIVITTTENISNLKSDRAELIYLRDFIAFQENMENSPFAPELVKRAFREFSKSKAQLHQDLIALLFSNFKSNGYFVEFGATDGVRFSNSHLLEKTFQWNGILAEPAKKWHSSLKAHRDAAIETRCVWKNSGEKLEFNETEIGELSTLELFTSADMHSEARISGVRYFVDTISLEDLLDHHEAPHYIDYLSIDTEGSEFEILNSFNFAKYSFGFISCEHNYTRSREQVFELLSSKGYLRVLEDQSLFDDWFIHGSLIKAE